MATLIDMTPAEADRALWNAAWEIATEQYLTEKDPA